MTHEDPLVDILTRRVIELEAEIARLKDSQVTVTFSNSETQPMTPNFYQNHSRCIDYCPACDDNPCYDCDLVMP